MRRILYFVGAGLTKSLALPSRPVPAMFDFIATAAEYVYDDVVLTTLAELENAEPYPYIWEPPQARRLAKMLVGKGADRTPALRSRFGRVLRERPGESIENLLERTAAQGKNMSSQSSDIRFRYAIRRVFDLIGWDLDWTPLDSFLRHALTRSETSHTFVSFNYDLALDRGIQRCLAKTLDFSTAYGFEISLQVNEDPPKNTNGAVSYPPAIGLAPLPSTGSKVLLLKPHGSLNWLATPSVDPSKTTPLSKGEAVVLPLHSDGSLRYFSSTETFQRVHPADSLPVDVEPLILTPTVAKRPDRAFLRQVREREEEAIREADEVFILGWSMPRTDSDQECLIRSNVTNRGSAFSTVTVVNFFAGVDYYTRVAEVFGADKAALRVFNAGFRDFAARVADG